VTITITNTLDESPDNESIGIGDCHLYYEFDDGTTSYPARSPGYYDHDVESDPTELWDNDCVDATQKTCSGFPYFGGANECGQNNKIWRTFSANKIPPTTTELTLQGKVWSIDSWDGEKITIKMTDSQGDVIAQQDYVGNERDQTVTCQGTGGW
jgi:hypothetical protein